MNDGEVSSGRADVDEWLEGMARMEAAAVAINDSLDEEGLEEFLTSAEQFKDDMALVDPSGQLYGKVTWLRDVWIEVDGLMRDYGLRS